MLEQSFFETVSGTSFIGSVVAQQAPVKEHKPKENRRQNDSVKGGEARQC